MSLWGRLTNVCADFVENYNLRLPIFQIRFMWNGYKNPMSNYRYFTDAEVEGLDKELVAKLDQARHIAGVPFIITSGKRSPADNERAMGVDGSAHIKGLAVDLRCSDSSTRFAILRGLILAGFNRIGLYDRHVHCDSDTAPDKPQAVVWTGLSH